MSPVDAPRPVSGPSFLLRTGVLAAACFAIARLSLYLPLSRGGVPSFSLASGLALGVLILWGRRFVLGVFIGAWAAAQSTGVLSPAAAAGIAVGHALMALVGSEILRRARGTGAAPVAVDAPVPEDAPIGEGAIARARDVVSFFIAAAVGSTVNAAVIALVLASTDLARREEMLPIFDCWWRASAAGVLLAAPAFLSWMTSASQPTRALGERRRPLQTAACVALPPGLALVAAFVDLSPPTSTALLFATLAITIFVAQRAGVRAATAITMIVAAILAVASARGQGPLARPAIEESLFLVQACAAILASAALASAVLSADRARSEQAARERGSLHRSIAEDGAEMITRTGADGTLVFANDAFCRTFGRSREELVGCAFAPPIAEEDKGEVVRRIGLLTRDRNIVQCEHRAVVPGGELRWQRWTHRALFDAQGRLRAVQSAGHDITARKEAELALARRLRELEEARPGADRPGNELSRLMSDLAEEREKSDLARRSKAG